MTASRSTLPNPRHLQRLPAHLGTEQLERIRQAGARAGVAVNPATPPGPWDLILLDVDNGPSFLVHQVNERLYAAAALATAVAALAPGGVLAIWAAQREPTLHARLTRIAPTQEILLPVERGGRALECALYITHPPSGPPR